MRRAIWIVWAAAAVAAGCGSSAASKRSAEPPRPPGTRPPDWAPKVASLERKAGLLDLYVDRAQGKLLAVLPAPSGPRGELGTFLYVAGITTGLGSNPVGLDRGQIGAVQLLTLRRVGARVLFEAQNSRYRALSNDPAEVAAVRESFATSVVWAGEILGQDAAGRPLVDLTSFAVRDAHGVAEQLRATDQGRFALDRERSAVDFENCLAFPGNVELEATVTFGGEAPGPELRAVAPDPRALTLTLHQSLLALPEPGYRPRAHDPRMGSFAIDFHDYAAPLAGGVDRRWIVRHRLQKKTPGAAPSEPVEPIVYYVDRGAPEPVRSALVDGASWWAAAFEAAGFTDAFRVELLPPGAHPLDARYNVIQWVHRATRGWSYGGGVVDPRTGEMVKGHVTLGSLRIRQDRLLFEGLAGVGRTGSGAADDPIQLSLARIRQLAAHEVGHTLGFAHNFAASSYGRASVMDYPAPLVAITDDGALDFSSAYGAGVGEWDRVATRWAYAEFDPGAAEAEELEKIAREALERGLVFLTDQDARAPGTAHPTASLWDNGEDPVAALDQALRVRRIALARFGEGNLSLGTPAAQLEEVLATVYLHHRFQLVAAAKLVGGLDYRHALAGDGQPPARPVSGERQRRAIQAILQTLDPAVLDLPEEVVRRLAPRTPELAPSREQFLSRTGAAFDALGAAATAADLALAALFEPSRAARLVDFHRRAASTPDLGELLDVVVDRAFGPGGHSLREAEIARVVQRVLVDRLLALSSDPDAAPWVRARVDLALSDLLQKLDAVEPAGAAERAHLAALAADIGRHLSRPSAPREPARAAQPAPPGEPIGGAGPAALETLGDCSFVPPE
jgi:hypothetical protein